ncbi:MAG: fibronectin type III domain-containing protein [Caldilineales bacterium]|nr:fibronectin type III domain-containing protein [Caldilineales bacterium]
MTINQSLLWVALPNGLSGEGADRVLRLSVFVAARLKTDEGQTLALFPDFLDWPTLMQPGQVSFVVETDNNVQIDAAVASAAPDSALWQALFGPDTPVRPFVFDDMADRPIVTFPVRQVLNYIKDRYQDIAIHSPEDLPSIQRSEDVGDNAQGFLGEVFGDLVLLHGENLRGETEADLSRRLEESMERARSVARARRAAGQRGGALIEPTGIASPDAPANGFYRTMLFHYRPAQAKPVDLPQTEQEAQDAYTAQFDFHQMLSALGDFPELLRRLGLIIDLTVPIAALPQTLNEFNLRKVRVRPTWTSALPAGGNTDITPFTNYIWATVNGLDVFAPVPRQGEVTAGLWSPSANDIDVVQVDVDGAALKALNMGATLAKQIMGGGERAIDAPTADGVPALRTGGVSLVRTGRAKSLNDDFNRSLDLNTLLEADPANPPALFAEDLTRGYRLDVRDPDAGPWRSLHQRLGTYNALNFAPGPFDIPDEGYTQVSVTGPAQAPNTPVDPASELYLHESLVTWDGWSLSAPRPGKSISRDPRAPDPDAPETQPQRVENKALTSLPLETSFRVQDGTLPRLRFGHRYQFRVRAVDLAGNSPTLDEASAVIEKLAVNAPPVFPKQGELPFSRFEPVNPPELVPREEFTEGESLERMVIRSNFDQNAANYAANHPPYLSENERHAVAPKAALQMIETHGLLDAAFDAKPDLLPPDQVAAIRQEVYALAVRESGNLADTSLPTVRFIRTSDDPDSNEGYAIHSEEQLITPYLPDPWAVGVVLRGLPGVPMGQDTVVRFGGNAWHEATPFRIRIAEGEGASVWDDATRVLTVLMPASAQMTVRVCSLFGGDLEQAALWRWLLEAMEQGKLDAAGFDTLSEMIKESRHWMVTPFRNLTLVHAVQQPLAQPSLQMEAERWQGATRASLRGEVDLHAPSTAKLDLLAAWKETRDDPSKDSWETFDAQAHVTEIPTYLEKQPISLVGIDQEAEDALDLRDERTLIFDTQKCEFVARRLRDGLANPQGNLSPTRRDRMNSQLNLAEKITGHEFGDTRYRHVRYHMTATTRFREYFAPALWQDPANITRVGDEIELDILSTARPAAPHVRYVLPTFAWEQDVQDDGSVSSRRIGGGVRVYLERPWFSSGEGELMAVVLKDSLPDRKARTYEVSTFWGQDPLWFSPPVELPKSSAFKNALRTETHVQLAEFFNEKAQAVLFQPQWDGERKLWYCDLELDTAQAYYPFIRLALARYQPMSLNDLRLSSVVLADFVQTAPDRAASVTRDANDPGVFHVTVAGVTYQALRMLNTAVIPRTSQMRIHIERRRAEIEDETLGWVAASPDDPAIVLTPGGVDARGVTTWTGQIAAPADLIGERLRLVIREFEQFDNSRDERLVHADIIEL